MKRWAALLCMGGTLSCARTQSPPGADPFADAPAYLKPVHPGASIRPILTTGQRIPATRGGGEYLVVGIPDGLGLHRRGDHLILLSNHEFLPDSGGPAGPLPGGARVSEFMLSVEGTGARGAWILDVQAHTLRIEPVRETVEGGQYLHVVWRDH
jgi:hypothetical protein